LNKLNKIVHQRLTGAGPQMEQPGPDDIGLSFMSADGEKFTVPFDESFQQALGKVLLAPIENNIRDANRQIRATKERFVQSLGTWGRSDL